MQNYNKTLDFLLQKGTLNPDLDNMSVELKVALRDHLLENNVKRARTDFYSFVKLMAPTLITEGFVDGVHIKVICEELQKVVRDVEYNVANLKLPVEKRKAMRKPRLQVFLPPRSMKSKLCSNLFPAWVFGVHPEWSVMALGNSTKFAEDNLGRYTKEIVMSPEYQVIFPDTEVKKDERGAGRWSTTRNGKYFCTGAGSSIAGRGAHIILCDDVLSEQSAYSDIERTKINEWYEPGVRTRLHPTGAEVLINTRWHLEDLSGYLLEKDKKHPWKVISIPAILDEDSAELLGKEVGESYWPELWGLEHFEALKDSWPASKFAALYMQTPVPSEGSIIREEDFKIWSLDEPPDVEYIVASFDTAFSEKERADNSAYSVWGIFYTKETGYLGNVYIQANMILLGADKGKWSFTELMEKCEEIKEKWDPNLFVIERKASGIHLIRELQLARYPIHEYLPDKGKLERTYACEQAFKAGRIWVPEGKAYATDLIVEMTNFPFFSKDDLHDTATQAIIWMRENMFIPSPGELGFVDEEEEQEKELNRRRASYW